MEKSFLPLKGDENVIEENFSQGVEKSKSSSLLSVILVSTANPWKIFSGPSTTHFSFSVLTHSDLERGTIIPILYLKKQKHGERKELPQGHSPTDPPWWPPLSQPQLLWDSPQLPCSRIPGLASCWGAFSTTGGQLFTFRLSALLSETPEDLREQGHFRDVRLTQLGLLFGLRGDSMESKVDVCRWKAPFP